MENLIKDISDVMPKNTHGHGMDHINRVYNMSMDFAKGTSANIEIVTLTSLLHDVDDYKIFGDTGDKLPNATNIMKKNSVSNDVIDIVLSNINNMGYSKRLKGIIPTSLEGKIVSDADFCDAMGATGIVRSIEYSIFKGNPFWNKDFFPEINPSVEKYKESKVPVVNHFFEKLLKLKDLMLTEAGKREAIKRYDIMVLFLQNFFEENKAYDWIKFLNENKKSL
ncbi:MAG: HD domain-containing protein [Alphaproteobacteria bacterium]